MERRARRGRRKVGGRDIVSAVGWRRERRTERVNGEAIVGIVVWMGVRAQESRILPRILYAKVSLDPFGTLQNPRRHLRVLDTSAILQTTIQGHDEGDKTGTSLHEWHEWCVSQRTHAYRQIIFPLVRMNICGGLETMQERAYSQTQSDSLISTQT